MTKMPDFSEAGAAFALGALALSFTGGVYGFFLFGGLGLSFFDFATVSDLVVYSMKNPIVLFVCLGIFILMYMTDFRHSRWHLGWILAQLCLSSVIAMGFGLWDAKTIQDGRKLVGTVVCSVQSRVSSGNTVQYYELYMIGSLGSFVFAYDRNMKRSVGLVTSNLINISCG